MKTQFRKGQVWVETVIYTLIGLSLLGLVLGLVTPKIHEYRDRSVIEQTINSLNVLDSKVEEVLQAPGNTRVVEFRLRRGSLYVDQVNNIIYFEIPDSHSQYSEANPPTPVMIGRIEALTTPGSKLNTVRLSIPYAVDLQNEGNESIKRYGAAATPYRFSVENNGNDPVTHKEIVLFREISGA